jgi:hypothetical protein
MTPTQGADEDGTRAPVNRPSGRGGGQLTATVDVEAVGNGNSIKQVVKKLLRDIGADKYVKICE